MYRIIKIKKHCMKAGGKIEYFVKWAGLNNAGEPWPDTWLFPFESDGQINITQDMIDLYEAPRVQGVRCPFTSRWMWHRRSRHCAERWRTQS